MADSFDLSDAVAVVTGGGGLIGKAVSTGLYDHGATVVVVDTDTESGEALVSDLGDNAYFKPVDLTDEDEVQALVEWTTDELGSLDVLVNCAYPKNENYGCQYEDVTLADWRENLRLHLDSYYLPIKAAVPVMKEQGGGRIVNFGSIYGVQAPNFSVYEGLEMTSPVEYSVIKGGIINFTRYLASYLGPQGIRVNAISPGGVFDDQHSTFVDRYEKRTTLGRMADPEDVVGAVVFLASSASRYVTGHNLVVDGGWTIC